MANVVVIGAQWGDEGKGKIVDWLSRARRRRGAIPRRPQCRAHARHRREDVQAVIAAVRRRQPGQTFRHRQRRRRRSLGARRRDLEADAARRFGYARQLAYRGKRHADPAVAPRTRSRSRGGRGTEKIGTTGRGIGPAYEDKVGRRAIRFQDLAAPATLGPKVDRILAHHNALRRGLGQPEIVKDQLIAELIDIAPKVLPYMDVTWDLLDQARRHDKRILFEGAQGALLDVDHGTYPFVTSSNTIAARRQRVRVSGRASSAMYSALRRPTRPASGPGRFRRS